MTRTLLSRVSLAAFAAVAVAACAKDPTAGKQKAAVGEARAETPVAAAAETLALTPANTRVAFVGAKVTAQHPGRFDELAGTVSLAGDAPEDGRVEVVIQTASLSLDEKIDKLTAHLKSPDFFDVARYPTARFVSTEIRPGSGVAGATHTVVGNLELVGVTRSVTFPASIAVTPDAVKVDAEFGINRKDWGIEYPGMPDDLIKDNVLIQVKVDAARAASRS